MANDGQALTVSLIDRAWRWGGWIIGGALTAGARHLIFESGSSTVLEAIGIALLFGGACVCLTWGAFSLWQALPPQRLKRLVPLLDEARQRLTIAYIEGQEVPVVVPRDVPVVRTVTRKLDARFMIIPHPEESGTREQWHLYLRRLIGEAQAGEIKKARLVWDEMRGEES